MLIQCQLPHILVTTLEEFRSSGVNAPSHVHITYYTDFLDDKGIVLVGADVANSSKDVSVTEARTLLALLHSYYLRPAGYAKVYALNHEPHTFDFEELLAEARAAWGALARPPPAGG
uniref:ATP synthase mitochondrial F1 complex assembly factor 1 n=1 Tax=Tetraselmis sp. GSL018 TaxID=582737 RepID=A0A061S836_9CHLO